MLRLDSISVYYGKAEAVQNISLEVEEKSLTAILGANGAGKSTVLNCIAGLIKPATGSIFFEGKTIHQHLPYQRVGLGISLIPERRRLFPYLTIKENLELGAYTRRARPDTSQTMEWAFTLFPRLMERRKQIVGTLSGGEQQMVAIARGLMSKPRLLMVDEPSIGLAPMICSEVFKLLKEINATGVTVFLVEQNVYHSLKIAGKAFVLEHGRIVMQGAANEIFEQGIIRKTYLGL
jgi:branched-chain amino acid transport system ATP-binding protein